MSKASSSSSSLISSLHQTLLILHNHPYPTLANPSNCPKRASVALILRIRPSFSQPPPSEATSLPQNTPYADKLNAFFSYPWVQSGVPEVLFIKRAARRGDRWTSQIALPGGKRDPSDPSDEATAEREVLEEVGLNISSSSETSIVEEPADLALLAGPLSQRVITTDFGAVPLMVLCPFVYLLTMADVPTLKLQPAEVASAHWIPVAALLDPAARTYERADIITRTPLRRSKLTQTMLDWNLGQTLYAAVRLRPSESIFSSIEEQLPSSNIPANSGRNTFSQILQVVKEDLQSALAKWGLIGADPDPSRRLLLWGLTHGITSDFLGLLPVAKGLDWWRWPTLSRSDVRLMIWLVSYRFRKVKTDAIKAGRVQSRGPPFMIGEGLGVYNSGKQDDTVHTHSDEPIPATVYSAAGFLLDGYFEQIQRAVYVALMVRFLFGSATAWYLWKRYWQRRK
ncbi:MAG: hypothetical protein GOMPHAMPRED_008004 [Gomphillus americanus]|uniref:Nudix hydrolase domain-containing protein n=1 Tax=Gomphillus americanus TaxID=1940652 RepID=A0A8H3EW55_9LECA|nr:MAG: hypothetical protein GOMPHAMPRED_008004 [Gomphillus americanus]